MNDLNTIVEDNRKAAEESKTGIVIPKINPHLEKRADGHYYNIKTGQRVW